MARPIAETPVLRGKDAKRFMENMKNVKPISKEEAQEQEKVLKYFKSIAEFEL